VRIDDATWLREAHAEVEVASAALPQFGAAEAGEAFRIADSSLPPALS
jgi:hypothetical protein